MATAVHHTEGSKGERKALRGWWLLLPFQISLVATLGLPHNNYGWLLQGMHLLTASLCARGLAYDRQPFSLNQVFWVFTFVFMALMPSLFYNLNFLPHGQVADRLLLQSSGMVLGSTLLYTGLGLLLQRRYPETKRNTPLPAVSAVLPHRFIRWAPWLMGLCVLVMMAVIGPANLWLSIPFWSALEARVPNTLLQLLIQYGLRGAMLFICLGAAYGYRTKQLSARYLSLLLLLALIGNFPLSLSRYLAGTFYLAILLWALPLRHLKPGRFALLLLATLLLAAPLLNAPRMKHFTLAPGEQRNFSFLLRTSYSADYDAYAMLCRTLQYTDSLGPSGGRQLAGALLFFVPRSAWPQKPVGSGSKVFDYTTPRADGWNNVSCPLLAEGYINFGMAGSLMFTLLLSSGIFWYDRTFWARRNQRRRLSYPVLFYPVLVGLLLLLLRGDMLSSVAYTSGLFVSGGLLWLIFKRRF